MGMKQDILGANGIYIHLIYIVNAYLGVTLSSVMIGRLILDNVNDKHKVGRCYYLCNCRSEICLNINVFTIFKKSQRLYDVFKTFRKFFRG